MPRPRRCRRVCFEPGITYFKPAGVPMTDLDEVVLMVDEFEAIRLKDVDGLEQEQCAQHMNISQPTFHRLYLEARRKIADVIVNGKALKIEGGTYEISPQQSRKRRCYRRGEQK
ncbi:MAG TPA: hypothetical protein DSN98_07245 [Thermoplasmata archaeon]|nr:MAG TPA: hypothetical protein DSN98_07245 [Thermoplasmata archaeon]